jgi:hypothetical protein
MQEPSRPSGNTTTEDNSRRTMATPPQVTTISPISGPLAGGTQVSISGSGLSTATGVAFGALSAKDFVVDSDSLVYAVAPPSLAPGPIPVLVLAPGGDSAPATDGQFTYVADSPQAGGAKDKTTGADKPSDSEDATDQAAADKGAKKADGNKSDDSKADDNKADDSKADDSKADDNKAGDKKVAKDSKDSSAADKGADATDSSDSSSAKTGGKAADASGATKASDGGGGSPGYIPGGLAPVPDGRTGLGGTAGTGAGFGVGTLMAGGGGSAAPSNLPYYKDPGLNAQLVQSLIGILQNAASPDALEAQNIILRRMALQGDVVGARIPPPRNISEVGGYLNLLHHLKQQATLEQALAGALGVAGPAQPLGWTSNTQPLAMVAITNDRPSIPAQPSLPLTVLVRSDFASGVQAALKAIHAQGAALPLTGPSVITLPAGGTGTTAPMGRVLSYLGRTLTVAPNVALGDPAADAVALLSHAGTAPPVYGLYSRVLSTTAPTNPADYDAVKCTQTSQTTVRLTQAAFVEIAPILATQGYYSPSPIPVPPNSAAPDQTWPVLTNTTGLVAGSTQLDDELSLLYRPDQIARSVFAAMLAWTWNGQTFAP